MMEQEVPELLSNIIVMQFVQLMALFFIAALFASRK